MVSQTLLLGWPRDTLFSMGARYATESPARAPGSSRTSVAIEASAARAAELRGLLNGNVTLLDHNGSLEAPDCILIAHDPPEINALARLLEHIRPSGVPSLPVIVISSEPDPHLRRTALRSGAMEVLNLERLEPEILLATIDDALERFSVFRQLSHQADETTQVHEAGRTFEERMRATFEHAAVGLALVDTHGRLLAINPALATLTGYAADELRSKTFAEITHPNDVEADWTHARHLLAGETGFYDLEKRYIRKDGRVVWAHVRVSLAHEESTKKPFFIAVVQGVDAQKAAEREQRKLLELIEHSADFIATTDLDGRLSYLNPAGRRMIGVGDVDVGSLHFTDYVPPQWRDFFLDTVIETARTSGIWQGEMQLRNMTSNQLVDVFRSNFLLRDPDTGDPWCLATVTRDITQHKAIEKALAQADQQLRATLTANDVGLWHWDPKRDVMVGDRNFLRLFGFETHDEAMPLARYLDRVHPDDRPRVEAAVARVLESGGTYDQVHRIVHPDGSIRWLHGRGCVARGADGEPISFPGIGLDVTRSHETTERLLESDERYRTLLASIDDGFCIVDMILDESGQRAIDYRFVELNASFARQTGLEDAEGKTARELVPELDESWFEIYASVARTGETVRFDRHEPAMRRWFEVEAMRVGAPHRRRVAIRFRDVTERRRAEAAVRRSEARYKRVFETNLLGILHWNLQGSVHDANDEFLRIIGYDRADLRVGAVDWHRLTPPDHRAQDERAIEELRRTGKHAPLEKEYVRKDGTRIWVLVGSALAEGDTGVGFVLDISRQKQIEAALRESESRAREAAARAEKERAILDAILDAAPAGIIVADANGRLVRFNAANELLWGVAPLSESVNEYRAWKGWWADQSERRGRPVEPHEWAMARALRGETVRNDIVELEPFDRPGTRRTMVNSGAPVRDAAGRITGAIVVQMDISALVAAEAARRDSETRFRALADHIPQLAWMTDEKGCVSWYNRRWFDFTGTTFDEMKGWGWQQVHHPDHVARVVEKLRRHFESGEPWEDTFPMRGRDGQYRWFLSRAFPLRDDSGRIVSWFGTNTDVTSQQKAEEALREADRRKDEFIAILAHELRNPLAPVRTAVQILRKAGPPVPLLEKARDVIDRQITHMARLIDDLLDVSRIARGKFELHKERCDAAAIAQQTAEDYRASLEATGLTLIVPAARGPMWVDGDPVRIAQMIGNLLHNAGRFTDKGGSVEVKTELDVAHGMAIVRVEDTGVGIEPALLARLFDPFSQADQDLARSKGGLGLGLALTKGLAELHGGSIAAFSGGPSQGATFTLKIPLGMTPTEASSPEDGMTPQGSGLRVLVVEDNQDAAETLVCLLEIEGHTVKQAFDGTTAVELAREFQPHVVISDIGLPGELDGYGVAKALRAEPSLEGVFLIALSGYSNDEARSRSREVGFNVHLVKPPDFVALEKTLANIPRR